MLDAKLQIKPGQSVALVNNSFEPEIKAERVDVKLANVVIVFVISTKDFTKYKKVLLASAKRGATPWLAYPKAKQLGTHLNRDIIRDIAQTLNLQTVRQIAINETWSALRLK